MIKLTKPLAIALGLVLISVLSLSLAYAYKTSLNPVIKPELIKSLNQGLKTLYFSFINPEGILLGIILVSAAIIGFFVYKNAIIALPDKAPVIPTLKNLSYLNVFELILILTGVVGSVCTNLRSCCTDSTKSQQLRWYCTDFTRSQQLRLYGTDSTKSLQDRSNLNRSFWTKLTNNPASARQTHAWGN